jgi:hypothetical protein
MRNVQKLAGGRRQAGSKMAVGRLRVWRLLVPGLTLFALMAFSATPRGGTPQPASARQRPDSGIRANTAMSMVSNQGTPTIPIYGPIQAKSIAARTDDPKAIQDFVDEIFTQTGFGNAALSLRNRVTRAELAYREGRQKPADIDTLVRAVNKTVGVFPLPSYFKTSRDQVVLQQVFVHAHAAKGLWDENDDPNALGPSEATFYTLFMTYQKFFNPSYQLDSEKWAKRQRALMANHPSPEFLKIQARLKAKDVLLPQFRNLRWELGQEKSDATQEGHALFDRLGFIK